MPIINFILDWESENVNHLGQQKNSSENFSYCPKEERSFSFTGKNFQASGNLIKKAKFTR